MILKLPNTIVLSLVLIVVLAASAVAQQNQQKRQTPARTQPTPTATPVPTPPPTFDTLLAANSYKMYVEVRSVGQLIRSPSVNEILEPILKLAGPPPEFRTVVSWLNASAEEVMTSRMLFATEATAKGIPSSLIAIEFASPEEASKFQQKLNGFLQKVLPAPAPGPTGETKQAEPAPPPYHMQQAGSLILITSTPLDLKKLRPAGSKLLSESVNFRVAHNRFNTESIFIFADIAEFQKEDVEERKRMQEEHDKAVAELKASAEAIAAAKVELQKEIEKTEPQEPEEPEMPEPPEVVGVVPKQDVEPQYEVKAVAESQQVMMTLGMIFSSLSQAEATWPDALGIAISLDGESFDLRALLINAPGEKSDPIPFFPALAPGPAIVPDGPNILPADTEMLVMLSLDFAQLYARLARPEQNPVAFGQRTEPNVIKIDEPQPPLAMLEKQVKIKIKDDLLPLIGPEIVMTVPMTGFDWLQPPQPQHAQPTSSPSPSASPSPSPSPNANETAPDPSKPTRSPAIVLSLRDKEGMRALLPKLIESLAFKGVNSFAQTERREDIVKVSIANLLSYAFIGNSLVLSPDTATTRHIVDSYLKHETLAGDPHFKNYTRWQPRQLQGQIYVSPVLMESYRTWIQQPTTPVDEKTRAFLTRFSIVAQPVTYSLSNEGFGPLHELHIPKNLVLLFVAGAAGGTNNPPAAVTDAPSNPTNP